MASRFPAIWRSGLLAVIAISVIATAIGAFWAEWQSLTIFVDTTSTSVQVWLEFANALALLGMGAITTLGVIRARPVLSLAHAAALGLCWFLAGVALLVPIEVTIRILTARIEADPVPLEVRRYFGSSVNWYLPGMVPFCVMIAGAGAMGVRRVGRLMPGSFAPVRRRRKTAALFDAFDRWLARTWPAVWSTQMHASLIEVGLGATLMYMATTPYLWNWTPLGPILAVGAPALLIRKQGYVRHTPAPVKAELLSLAAVLAAVAAMLWPIPVRVGNQNVEDWVLLVLLIATLTGPIFCARSFGPRYAIAGFFLAPAFALGMVVAAASLSGWPAQADESWPFAIAFELIIVAFTYITIRRERLPGLRATLVSTLFTFTPLAVLLVSKDPGAMATVTPAVCIVISTFALVLLTRPARISTSALLSGRSA